MPQPQVFHLLASCCRGVLQSLVPRGWWHAAVGLGEHLAARDIVGLLMAGRAVGCWVAARPCCSPPLLLAPRRPCLRGPGARKAGSGQGGSARQVAIQGAGRSRSTISASRGEPVV